MKKTDKKPPAAREDRWAATGAVARWARRFRRLACVLALPRGREPDFSTLRSVSEARRGGVGIPRAALAGLSEESRGRLLEKPFVLLDQPDPALARVAAVSGPRAPGYLVEASVSALSHGAPVLLFDRRDALAIGPLVTHAVAIPGDAASRALAANLESVLRSSSACVQDAYGQLENAGTAIRDLVSGRARERTLQGLLLRLTRARKAWALRDAARRFRKIVLAAEEDAASRGVEKGQPDPLLVTQPVLLGYVDLLPLLLTRLGAGSELRDAWASPLALLALGLAPVVLVEGRAHPR